ncbi:MAG: Mov34/MPN/PAD-1 family protein [Candidatus Bathyarchaeota archaeon]|nr:Mov34/MPN/PAD-1 family protein [Candidatus Bathyarchaeota archaeon]
MLDLALEQHPYEVVLLLRGRVNRGSILVEDFLVPPLAVAGRSFAEFPLHMLPIDFSIVGTAHSHPSGTLSPSTGDLNNFYGRVMIILASPYTSDRAAAFSSLGERISIKVLN